jgi:hypothetical protein
VCQSMISSQCKRPRTSPTMKRGALAVVETFEDLPLILFTFCPQLVKLG